jgi:hypothetical protein
MIKSNNTPIKRTQRDYSLGFKLQVVDAVEKGDMTYKQERVHWKNYSTRYEAQQDVMNYICMCYNSRRLHSYLNYQSPNDCEERIETVDMVS